LPLNLVVRLELAGVHAPANLAAMGAELWASLEKVIDQVIIERDQRKTP
jgi:hypothetical protein